jgi:cytochrome b561
MTERGAAWPLPVRLIHWASAALIIGALTLGATMVQLVQDAAERFDLTQTHKSIGIAVLALTVLRLWVRMITTAPPPAALPTRLFKAAKVAHRTIYALLVVMPLSGWLMTTTTPIRVPTVVFGLFELPYPLAPDLPTYALAHAVHVTAAISLAALIVLHVAAALFHALWWRDATMVRMWRACDGPNCQKNMIGRNRAETPLKDPPQLGPGPGAR